MAYARTKLSANSPRNAGATLRSAVAESRVALIPADIIATDESSEIRRLRAANAQLKRELAALKAREAEAQQLAERDGLTGLYNRRRLVELLESTVADAERQGQYVGLLFIDLNGFKSVNDECGHATGDKILTMVAARITARVRTGDIVGRYGGDEFVVVLANVPDPSAVSRVADAVRERVSLPYWINGEGQQLTAAIGESMYPYDGQNAAALLQRADEAMYRLKLRLDRPLVSLGSVPQPRLTRRRSDKAKPRMGGAP
jgi:diguanylate cyclase (GGDEF)-like protein